ncbi:hypothetical protein PILCRDRAFT_491764 [Piloderma croceum F 1598]|uniref:Uncharacterized protein n=1 Tax=Piloderma croceum (strain F 1598) TaxID=765440 RepID=A0A0C3FQ41_PILCF|nr:hypothetical protein PILCRDRAFT_491764 [Piloderma croceum F 1598]
MMARVVSEEMDFSGLLCSSAMLIQSCTTPPSIQPNPTHIVSLGYHTLSVTANDGGAPLTQVGK